MEATYLLKTLLLGVLIQSSFLLNCQAQTLKDVGAGVIEFFMNSPNVIDHSKPWELNSMRIIRDLLIESSRRGHEINVAQAGKTEFTIRDPSGNEAQIVRDVSGNIYLLKNGVIYPINKTIVEQAKTINSEGGYQPTQKSFSEIRQQLMDEFKQNLSLTYEQCLKVNEFYDEFDQKLADARMNSGGDPNVLRNELIILNSERDRQIESILNYEQVVKFQEWKRKIAQGRR